MKTMVSFATVLQAIQGGKFPASRERLIKRLENKRGLYPDETLDEVKEFLMALPERSVVMNPSELARELKAAHKAIARRAGFQGAETFAIAEKESDLPLGKGEVEADDDLGSRLADLHEKYANEEE